MEAEAYGFVLAGAKAPSTVDAHAALKRRSSTGLQRFVEVKMGEQIPHRAFRPVRNDKGFVVMAAERDAPATAGGTPALR